LLVTYSSSMVQRSYLVSQWKQIRSSTSILIESSLDRELILRDWKDQYLSSEIVSLAWFKRLLICWRSVPTRMIIRRVSYCMLAKLSSVVGTEVVLLHSGSCGDHPDDPWSQLAPSTIWPSGPPCAHGYLGSFGPIGFPCAHGYLGPFWPSGPPCAHGYMGPFWPSGPPCAHGYLGSFWPRGPPCAHGYLGSFGPMPSRLPLGITDSDNRGCDRSQRLKLSGHVLK
jgi:hypothetical protein